MWFEDVLGRELGVSSGRASCKDGKRTVAHCAWGGRVAQRTHPLPAVVGRCVPERGQKHLDFRDGRDHNKGKHCRSRRLFLDLLVELPQVIEKLATFVEVRDIIRNGFCGGRDVADQATHRLAVSRHGSEDLLG